MNRICLSRINPYGVVGVVASAILGSLTLSGCNNKSSSPASQLPIATGPAPATTQAAALPPGAPPQAAGFQPYVVVPSLPAAPPSVGHRHRKLRLIQRQRKFYLEDADNHYYAVGQDNGQIYPEYEDPNTHQYYELYYDNRRDRYYRVGYDTETRSYYRGYVGDDNQRFYDDDQDYSNYRVRENDRPEIVEDATYTYYNRNGQVEHHGNRGSWMVSIPVIAGAYLLLQPRSHSGPPPSSAGNDRRQVSGVQSGALPNHRGQGQALTGEPGRPAIPTGHLPTRVAPVKSVTVGSAHDEDGRHIEPGGHTIISHSPAITAAENHLKPSPQSHGTSGESHNTVARRPDVVQPHGPSGEGSHQPSLQAEPLRRNPASLTVHAEQTGTHPVGSASNSNLRRSAVNSSSGSAQVAPRRAPVPNGVRPLPSPTTPRKSDATGQVISNARPSPLTNPTPKKSGATGQGISKARPSPLTDPTPTPIQKAVASPKSAPRINLKPNTSSATGPVLQHGDKKPAIIEEVKSGTKQPGPPPKKAVGPAGRTPNGGRQSAPKEDPTKHPISAPQ